MGWLPQFILLYQLVYLGLSIRELTRTMYPATTPTSLPACTNANYRVWEKKLQPRHSNHSSLRQCPKPEPETTERSIERRVYEAMVTVDKYSWRYKVVREFHALGVIAMPLVPVPGIPAAWWSWTTTLLVRIDLPL